MVIGDQQSERPLRHLVMIIREMLNEGTRGVLRCTLMFM